MRDSWETYFKNIAEIVASRSTCPRAKVGALIVKNNRIIATGYNGAPSGWPHCEDVGCLMENGHCIRVTHAEVNALLQAGMEAKGAVIYCTHTPCKNCTNLIDIAGLEGVVFITPYG